MCQHAISDPVYITRLHKDGLYIKELTKYNMA